MSKVVKYNERVTMIKAVAVELVDGAPVTLDIVDEVKGSRSIEAAQRIIDRKYKDYNLRPLVESVEVKVIQHELALDKFLELATATVVE